MNKFYHMKSRISTFIKAKTIIMSSTLSFSTPMTKNVLKRIFVDTILIHVFATFLNIFLTILRDNYIQEICWSEKPECKCDLYIAFFYIFCGVIIQVLCPFCQLITLIFGLVPNLLKKTSLKILTILQLLSFCMLPYILALYYMEGSPRAYCYLIHLCLIFFYSMYYAKKILKYDLQIYWEKMRYLIFYVFGMIAYFLFITYVGPYAYHSLALLAQNKTKNIFQIIILLLTAFYEAALSYLFIKISKQLAETGDHTFLILIAKYYYIILYSLRIGNILYLDYTDWGFYLQYISFVIFIFQHTTGISLFTELLLKPFIGKFFKKAKGLRFYVNYNNRILNIWRKLLKTSKEKITPVRKVKLSFGTINSGEKNVLLGITQRNAFMILCFQKLEFLFIYVPTLLFLWLHRTWQGPEPFYGFTIGCTFEVTNISFQGSSIISLIVIDFVASAGLATFMYYKGKLNELHDVEKFNGFVRVLIFMGYQLTFEYWVSHFSSYQLLVD